MKKLILYSLFIFAVILSGNGNVYSANEYFRSISSGNWNSTSTWEMSPNNSTWSPATTTPDATSNDITVRSPHIVTVTANVSANELYVNNGATLSINSGVTFTIVPDVGDEFTLYNGATLSGSGLFKTEGSTVILNIREGSGFYCDINVTSGFTQISDLSAPYNARLFGNVTVDSTGNLNTDGTVSYTLYVYGNLTNNGTLSGTSSNLRLLGPTLINNGNLATPNFYFDSTTTVSGTGTFTGNSIYTGNNGNVYLLNDVTFSPTNGFLINNGGSFSANNNTLTVDNGLFTVFPGGTVANSGLIRMENGIDINLRGGAFFNADLNIANGDTQISDLSSPYNASLYGNVTVDLGATLFTDNTPSYTLYIYGNLTNDGTISGVGSTLKFLGSSLINNGTIASPNFHFDSTSTVSGPGLYTGVNIYVRNNGNVTLLNDMTFSLSSGFFINNGGYFSANSHNLTINTGVFTIFPGGTIVNSGLIRMEDGADINLRGGAFFNADLNISSGNTQISDLSPPYDATLYGNVTVESDGILYTDNTASYTLYVFGNITNNGTITGAGSTLKFYGAALINNGTVSSPNFHFDSTSTVSGTGSYTGGTIYVRNNGNVTLMNNVTFSPVTGFLINNGGVFSANTFILTINSGLFTIFDGGTAVNSGLIRMDNGADINVRTGSALNADINIASGSTQISELSTPYNARVYGDISIDSGAELFTDNTESYTLFVFGNIDNNGTISGAGDLEFQSGAHTIQGTGVWTTDAFILSGAVVSMASDHIFHKVDIRSGGTFDISNYKISFTVSDPITQNGTFTSVNGVVEYNGTSLQNVSYENITYGGLTINNPADVRILGNLSVNDTISIIQGGFNLNGYIITLSPNGYLKETPGNLLYGTLGFITITRNIDTPSGLNLGGLGAVLTSPDDLGSTEVRRGHTVQTGLDGMTSIKRYYDIMPTNNTDLHAGLVFNYDDSELNGKDEATLKLFKSTNMGGEWQFMGGDVDTASSDITIAGLNSYSRWSATSSTSTESFAVIMEGFYNTGSNNLNKTDTVRVYLRDPSAPYALVDSAIVTIDSLTFSAQVQFANAGTGQYYLQVKHRNSLETWSKDRVKYIAGTTFNYDFTFSADQAYGNNEVQKGSKFCMYSGDVTQNGFIDLTDVVLINNGSNAFQTGYVSTDVNGNSVVDLTDVIIAFNNSNLFVSVKKP